MADIEKDLVLADGQHSFILDNTKGIISCWVGPCKTTTSQSDSLVIFDQSIKDLRTLGR